MTAAARRRMLEILDGALEAPAGERSAFLDRACGGDLELRLELEAMLELEDEADSFLAVPALPRPEEGSADDSEIGLRIGHYRIVELLGRGGMGSVYRAVREDDFEIEVAVKLLHTGVMTGRTIERFHTERQILARLEHPNIARLLDGGTTPDGRPYLVMEHADGVPIDAHCDAFGLSTRRRLELFREVCSAIAFAHRNLVVHRDLKPANVLVTADGVPKLLDFGIAKLLDPVRGEITRAGDRPMTPRWASPEQVLGDPVTTASDVYALGLLLYKLLTGRLPCRLESCTFGELTRRICENDPLPPSVAVTRSEEVQTADGADRATPETVSRNRDGEIGRLRRRLAGDVDAIVLKALRKEPEHRYGSAEKLSDDVYRHLRGLPVAARKGTLLYRGGKFLRRHRVGLAAAGLVAAMTAAFLAREFQRLAAERERSARLAEVLWGLIDVADPDRGELTTRRMLDGARGQLAALEGEPELRVEILDGLGRMHRKLGNFAEARELVAESLTTWRELHPGDDVTLARRINNLGVLHVDRGAYEDAEEVFREALEMCARLGAVESGEGLVSLNNLATVKLYRGEFEEAEDFYRRVLEIRERRLGRHAPEVASSLRSLAVVEYSRGAFAAAEPLLREALDIRLGVYGPDHTAVASTLDLLGSVRLARGDPAEAESHFLRALAVRRQVLGDGHVMVARSERNLGLLLLEEGELATARVLLSRAYSTLSRSRPATTWRIADSESALGALLAAEGRFEEAEPCLVNGHRVLREIRGDRAVYTRQARRRLLDLYDAWQPGLQ